MGLFQPATRKQLKARIALCGPSKAGKSYTGLRLAVCLAAHEAKRAGRKKLKIAAVDTEHRSLSKYQGESPDGIPFDFDVMELQSFSPERYIEAVQAAEREAYDVILIDSLSHAWVGTDGALEKVDKLAEKGRGNKFTDGWRDVTPMHNRMIDTIVRARIHVVATMRTHMEYILEDGPNGKKVPRKVGMAPVQRKGMEYEFDIVGDIDEGHTLHFGGTRCHAITDKSMTKPGLHFFEPILAWLDDGEAAKDERAELATSIRAMYTDLGVSDEKRAEHLQAYDPTAKVLEDLAQPMLEQLRDKLTEAMKKRAAEKLARCAAEVQAQLDAPPPAAAAAPVEKAKEERPKRGKKAAAEVAPVEPAPFDQTDRASYLMRLFQEVFKDQAAQKIIAACEKRGVGTVRDWSEADIEEAISKLEHLSTTQAMEADLAGAAK